MASTVVKRVQARLDRADFSLWLEIFVLFNFACLAGDVFLAHSANAYRARVEYLPVFYSLFAAFVLALGLFLRVARKNQFAYSALGSLVGWSALAIGVAGVVLHLDSQFFLQRTLKSLTYTAPFVAPLSYAGLGCLLLMNRNVPSRGTDWARWILFFALGGFFGNFVLSLADHAVNGFFHWTEWIPVFSAALAVGFLFLATVAKMERNFLLLTAAILLLQMGIGTLGFGLHVWADLHGASTRLWDNIVSGAPPFAPLLFPNLALLGLLGILAALREVNPPASA